MFSAATLEELESLRNQARAAGIVGVRAWRLPNTTIVHWVISLAEGELYRVFGLRLTVPGLLNRVWSRAPVYEKSRTTPRIAPKGAQVTTAVRVRNLLEIPGIVCQL